MHPNAAFATKLKAWVDTKVDDDDVVAEAQRRGFITTTKDGLIITSSGEKFLEKWTSGKPASTYERKPVEIPNAQASRSSSRDSFGRRPGFEDSRQEGRNSGFGRSSSFQERRPYTPSASNSTSYDTRGYRSASNQGIR